MKKQMESEGLDDPLELRIDILRSEIDEQILINLNLKKQIADLREILTKQMITKPKLISPQKEIRLSVLKY